jgi:Fe-S oxidoreductase
LLQQFPALQRGYDSTLAQREVLLFPDTFTNCFEPGIGAAAIALLEQAGCLVNLGPAGLCCCGRPFISNGLLDRAVAAAWHNVERLHGWASRGSPIIACEPSCILTIKDDYPALFRGEHRLWAETVAQACLTFEEFLTSILIAEPATQLRWKAGPRQILLQAHCHQRSLIGTAPALQLLKHLPEADVIDLDAGCCGMAGSFGYEVEHYDISHQVGEQRLLPAVRQAGPDAVIVAPGFSCRLQIQHFTGRKAVHPAVLLRSFLA